MIRRIFLIFYICMILIIVSSKWYSQMTFFFQRKGAYGSSEGNDDQRL